MPLCERGKKRSMYSPVNQAGSEWSGGSPVPVYWLACRAGVRCEKGGVTMAGAQDDAQCMSLRERTCPSLCRHLWADAHLVECGVGNLKGLLPRSRTVQLSNWLRAGWCTADALAMGCCRLQSDAVRLGWSCVCWLFAVAAW